MPARSQRLFDLFCALREIIIMQRKFPFSKYYKDAERQYTNLCIKDGEDIPLRIMIRQDHYHYEINE